MPNILLMLEHGFPPFPELCHNHCTLCSHPYKHQSALPKKSPRCHQLHLTITFPLQRNPSCHSSTSHTTPGPPKLDTFQLTHCLVPLTSLPPAALQQGPSSLMWGRCVWLLSSAGLQHSPHMAIPAALGCCCFLSCCGCSAPLQMLHDQILNPAVPSCFFRR